METTETTKYPIDFDSLDKGSIISRETVEIATGIKYSDSRRFDLAALGLQKLIEDHFRLDKGIIVTVRIYKGSIVICGDNESSEVNQRRHERHIRGIIRTLYRMSNVDVTNLTSEERKRHERNLLNQSRAVQPLLGKTRRYDPKLDAGSN